ncbi:MAG: hypothetical protein WBC05_16885 [Sedimentisphaerales bacterium]
MSFKNPKNLIVVISVVAALMAGTVLLGGYANSKAADNEAPVKACQATGGNGCCPAMANTAAFAQVFGAVQTETGSSETPSTTDCPKPCCAGGDAEGICENPCPIPCPKPCCVEDGPKGCCGTSGMAGCTMTAAETAAQ